MIDIEKLCAWLGAALMAAGASAIGGWWGVALLVGWLLHDYSRRA